MKRLFFVLLILIAYCGYAQKSTSVTVQVLNSPDTNLRVILPVNDTYFPSAYKIYALNNQHQFKLDNNLVKPGIIHFSNNFKGFDFFTEPGQAYNIVFDANTAHPFNFTGANAEGQYLLNKLNRPQYQDRADKYAVSDSSIISIKLKINSDAANERRKFSSLYQQGKISKAFYDLAVLDIDYYYAATLSSVIFNNRAKSDFVDAWADLFKTYSLTNTDALATTSFYDYADQYANWYKTTYFREKNSTIKRFNVKTSNEYLIDWYHKYADNLSGATKEYMLARFLHRFINAKKYEPELVDLFNDFKQQYPNSGYNPYLQTGVDEIIAYHKKAGDKADDDKASIIDNYLAINSLEELLTHFKNKTVFVDIWATWCGPCKEEFAFSGELRNFLKDKNAAILYISTDVDERDKDWHDMIKYYNLAGNHIRTSDKLRQDLISKIWHVKSGYDIPRYVIIKDGKMVENDALRPSDKQKLYKQISKYL